VSGRGVAVVVVSYQSADGLPATLSSVRGQMRAGDELVVVDNGSRDGSADVARTAGATVLEPGRNLGFAAGCHEGVKCTSAPLLFFLNPDAQLQPGALDALRAAAERQPEWGAWQALVLMPGGHEINTAGGITHWLGLGWAGDCGRPASTAGDAPGPASFASGAALVVRRDAWDALGGFEPAYFMYCEDVDLSLRLRLAGWGTGIVPAARVEHDYAFSKGESKWYLLERNRWWTVLGAYPLPLLVALFPALLAFDLALWPIAFRGGWLRAKLRAQATVIRTLPWALRRRRAIQASRRASVAQFARALSSSLDSPYLGPVARQPLAEAAQRAYWTTVSRMVGAAHG